MTLARLIIDGPADGAWNMAIDESLLESARHGGGACLRFYQWESPTLSLGYFQRYADRREHAASRGCRPVRRSSGGGAIVHDRELTYSFTAAISSHVSSQLPDLYRAFHQSLVDVLTDLGIRAALCEAPPRRGKYKEPFLCFQRRTDGDVLSAGSKIAGSAQRRCRNAVLQHGSVLLETSSSAPETPGVNQLWDATVAPDSLVDRWTSRLSGHLGLTFAVAAASPNELERAESLRKAKFGSAKWTLRR